MPFKILKLLNRATVYENVAFALEIFGLPKDEIWWLCTKGFRFSWTLKNKVKSYPNQLSGGEQQRVAIARAIINFDQSFLYVMSQQVT